MKYITTVLAFCILLSCKKIGLSNPYDEEIPKERFSPYNFEANQIGKRIQLKWQNQSLLNNFSHYRLTTKIDNINNPPIIISKDSLKYIQEDVKLGKKYDFNLIAIAGNNFSNDANLSFNVNVIVTTIDVTNISSLKADVQANVQAISNVTIKSQAFQFQEIGNMNVTSTTSQLGGVGNYTITLFTLKPNTAYIGYAVCYDINNKLYRGEDIIFKTLP